MSNHISLILVKVREYSVSAWFCTSQKQRHFFLTKFCSQYGDISQVSVGLHTWA